jgi:hypothetical protein
MNSASTYSTIIGLPALALNEENNSERLAPGVGLPAREAENWRPAALE